MIPLRAHLLPAAHRRPYRGVEYPKLCDCRLSAVPASSRQRRGRRTSSSRCRYRSPPRCGRARAGVRSAASPVSWRTCSLDGWSQFPTTAWARLPDELQRRMLVCDRDRFHGLHHHGWLIICENLLRHLQSIPPCHQRLATSAAGGIISTPPSSPLRAARSAAARLSASMLASSSARAS